MRLGTVAVLALGLVPVAFAQRNLNPIGGNGNILNPGKPLTGPSPVTQGPAFGSMPVLGPLPTLGPLPPMGSGFSSSGFGVPTSGQRGGRYGGGRGYGGGTVYVPVPVYGGTGAVVHNPPPGEYDPIFGGYNPGGSYQQFDGGYGMQQQSPTVIINQNFQTEAIHPVIHDYTNVPLPEPGRGAAPQASSRPLAEPQTASEEPAGNSEQPIYLIAMKDHTIYPALAYWIEKDTLNYVTMQGSPNRVSLSLIDRELSKRLNDERGLALRLPAVQ